MRSRHTVSPPATLAAPKEVKIFAHPAGGQFGLIALVHYQSETGTNGIFPVPGP